MAKRGVLTHRKTRRLARLLDIDQATALGYLEALWHVAAEQRPRGDIGAIADDDLVDEMFVRTPDAKAFIAALAEAGWLDPHPVHRLIVHDWSIHADEHVRQRLHRRNQTFADGRSPWCLREKNTSEEAENTSRKVKSAESDAETPAKSPLGEQKENTSQTAKNTLCEVNSRENHFSQSENGLEKSAVRARAQPEPEPEPEPEPVSPLPPLACDGKLPAGDPPSGGGVIPFREPKPPPDAPLAEVEAWLEREEALEHERLTAAGYESHEIEACVTAMRNKRSLRALRLKSGGALNAEQTAAPEADPDLGDLRNAMALFRPDWPPPDLDSARRTLAACGGASIEAILPQIGELHRRGLRPDLSWDWFPKVLAKRFGAPRRQRK